MHLSCISNKLITLIQAIPLLPWECTEKATLLSIGVYSETKCRLLQGEKLCYAACPKRHLYCFYNNPQLYEPLEQHTAMSAVLINSSSLHQAQLLYAHLEYH